MRSVLCVETHTFWYDLGISWPNLGILLFTFALLKWIWLNLNFNLTTNNKNPNILYNSMSFICKPNKLMDFQQILEKWLILHKSATKYVIIELFSYLVTSEWAAHGGTCPFTSLFAKLPILFTYSRLYVVLSWKS